MLRTSLVLTLCLVFIGCAKDNSTPAASEQTTTRSASQTTAHALPDVKPGSHEDWCTEHALPESQCTLCNPALEAAFKATGDWCEEHGLPESHCKKCNPNLQIVRPAKTQ